MSRLRLALALVALALALPAGLLVKRSLDSLEFESAVRHEAVAERAFDEMERELSTLLAREEARPFEHYDAQPGSPLAPLPSEPYLVGYFQVDPDGSVHTPHAGLEGPEATRRIAALERLAAQAWSAPPNAGGALGRMLETPATPETVGDKAESAKTLAPGRTAAIGRAKKSLGKGDRDALAAPGAAAEGGEYDTSAYSLLQSLNRASDLRRSERKQKIVVQPENAPAEAASETYRARARRTPPSAEAARANRADDQLRVAEQRATLEEEESGQRERLDSRQLDTQPLDDRPLDALATTSGDSPALQEPTGIDEIRGYGAHAPLRIAIDPLVGRAVGDHHIVLARTVLVGERGVRQGLVIDAHALGSWLASSVLERSALGEVARVDFATDATPVLPPENAERRLHYQHRFAEPFDALHALLQLEPLSGVASATSIHALAALLGVVTAIGLLAVYRMTSVVVHFAERRSAFVASVSHELKTPLTAIRMYAEMLRDGLVRSEEKRDEYYATITDESERLSRLINNVLEFSRLEQGTRELDLVAGSLGDALREAAAKLGPHAEREGYSLRLEIDSDLPPVRFDRDAVTQLLFNLVDNAMKYARSGPKREIALTCRREGEGVVASVRDHGPGVQRRHLGRVFEPFYRGENELTRTTKGTGIGLALVRELAEAMGAAVKGENAPDGGFQVSIRFQPA